MADFNVGVPREDRLEMHNTDVSHIKYNPNGRLNPEAEDLQEFAVAVRSILRRRLPDGYSR